MQYKWTALIITSLGTLMAAIDARIVIVGSPIIAEQLHTGAEDVVWISQSYLLASTIGLLTFGRISDLFGKVRLFRYGLVVFTIGSAASALSENSAQLIGFRIIQGVGAAILMTTSVAIVTDSSPQHELGKMIGFSSLSWRVGSITGLTVSGAILALTNWRGLFYVNVPIGILGFIWAQKSLKQESVESRLNEKMDWAGAALFSVGFSMILLVITFLSYGSSASLLAIVVAAVGIFSIGIFLKIETTIKFPTLDLRLFRIRSFLAANLAQLIVAITWGSILILMAFYLEVGLGFSPLAAGLAITPVELTYTLFALVSGRLSDRIGSRFLSTFGILLTEAGLLLAGTFSSTTKYLEIAIILALIGAGTGIFTIPNARFLMSSVPSERRGVASALWNMMFQSGWTVSYGLVILLLTFGIQYNALSQLLEAPVVNAGLKLLRDEFLVGFRSSAWILAGINSLAIIPSAIVGSKDKKMS